MRQAGNFGCIPSSKSGGSDIATLLISPFSQVTDGIPLPHMLVVKALNQRIMFMTHASMLVSREQETKIVYEHCSSHDKYHCKGTMPFAAYSTYPTSKLTSQPFSCSCSYSMCTRFVSYSLLGHLHTKFSLPVLDKLYSIHNTNCKNKNKNNKQTNKNIGL